MSDSNFNAAEFLGESFTGAMSTEIVQVPPGSYPAVISKLEPRQGAKDGKPWMAVDITWRVEDATVREATGMDNPTVRQGVFLDLDPASGKIDFGKGKNVTLGRVRSALGQNDPNQSWSFNNLLGGAAKITVVQEPGKGSDSDKIYSRVKTVEAL